MSCFFVTGTDTNVGKTIVSRAIIQALQAQGIKIVGYKPIACGEEDSIYTESLKDEFEVNLSEDNKDVKTLMDSTNQPVTYQEVNSYTFTESSVPVLAALDEVSNIDINKINQDLDYLASRYQSVLVEGTYGWLTPINREVTFDKWVKDRKMPVVLVVGIKEGCVNHALLTAQSIIAAGVPLIGWVANRINPCLRHYAEIIKLLHQVIDAPLLGEIPYIHRPEQQELGHFITNLDRLTYLKTEIC
ncbi:dethiobiotin synthase [Gallibacterium trehalosifermentans]|uniref:ATP-dependent dethiobiotin synthetase BioD n=1 Tax=Gallibacterium trehalosifermentans TaxID=516935 RepID=A0ABV6GZ64_9PAST